MPNEIVSIQEILTIFLSDAQVQVYLGYINKFLTVAFGIIGVASFLAKKLPHPKNGESRFIKILKVARTFLDWLAQNAGNAANASPEEIKAFSESKKSKNTAKKS